MNAGRPYHFRMLSVPVLTVLLAEEVMTPAAWGGVVTLFVAAAAVLGWAFYRERGKVRALESALRLERAKPQQKIVVQSLTDGQREDRERAIQELQIARLRAELDLLRKQTGTDNSEAREAAKEAHELMVEKTRLEIDSLRLHINEMRRRNEDWRADPD